MYSPSARAVAIIIMLHYFLWLIQLSELSLERDQQLVQRVVTRHWDTLLAKLIQLSELSREVTPLHGAQVVKVATQTEYHNPSCHGNDIACY